MGDFLKRIEMTYQNFRKSVPTQLKEYIKKLKKLKSLMKMVLAVSAVLVAAIAIFVAVRSGYADANCIINYEQGCDVRSQPIGYILKVGFNGREDEPGWLEIPFQKDFRHAGWV